MHKRRRWMGRFCTKPYRESVSDKHTFGKPYQQVEEALLRSWEERSEATAYLVAPRARQWKYLDQKSFLYSVCGAFNSQASSRLLPISLCESCFCDSGGTNLRGSTHASITSGPEFGAFSRCRPPI